MRGACTQLNHSLESGPPAYAAIPPTIHDAAVLPQPGPQGPPYSVPTLGLQVLRRLDSLLPKLASQLHVTSSSVPARAYRARASELALADVTALCESLRRSLVQQQQGRAFASSHGADAAAATAAPGSMSKEDFAGSALLHTAKSHLQVRAVQGVGPGVL